MEITGRIILALPEISGISKAGNNWKKREYVLETEESFPKKIFFDFFGDKADNFPLQVGQRVNLLFEINSREYNGRWFTGISGIRADVLEAVAPQAPMGTYQAPQQQAAYPAAQTPGAVPPPPVVNLGSADEDLPF